MATNFDNLRDEDLLTVLEVMSYLKVCRATVQRWCKENKLPAVKIGKEYRIRWGHLKDWYDHLLADQNSNTSTQAPIDDVAQTAIVLLPQPAKTGRGRPAGRQATAG